MPSGRPSAVRQHTGCQDGESTRSCGVRARERSSRASGGCPMLQPQVVARDTRVAPDAAVSCSFLELASCMIRASSEAKDTAGSPTLGSDQTISQAVRPVSTGRAFVTGRQLPRQWLSAGPDSLPPEPAKDDSHAPQDRRSHGPRRELPCGWETQGPEEQVVAAATAHGGRRTVTSHAQQIMTMARPAAGCPSSASAGERW